jgi:oleate hydratase
MKAHIVGGGFGGLAAAAYLIRNAGVSGQDITVYEADERMGGGLFLGGSAETGYNMPASVFDNEFRCTFDLLQTIPSASGSAISVKDEFFTFNTQHPFHDRVHIVNRDGRDLVRLGLTPEALLDGRRIEEFFTPRFFSTQFWLLWSTIFGSLPQHSATEFRRYMNRALGLFPDLSDLRHVLRTLVNQYQAFIEPLVAWLRPLGVNFLAGVFVRDTGFAPSDGRMTVNRVDYERDGAATSVAVASDDIVVGSMTEAPRPRESGRFLGAVEAAGAGAHRFRQSLPSSSARSRCLPHAG